MLMFENGLFATFIPQILMLLGYLSCLIVPGILNHETADVPTPEMATVLIVETAHLNLNTVSTYEIQFSVPAVQTEKQPLVCYAVKSVKFYFKSSPICTAISFVEFSRPPPFFLS
jgi:hypothetical protein